MLDFAELSKAWEQHADRLLLIARSFGEPAEDAVQEAFLALAKRNELPNEPLAWLARVARNQLLQWKRSEKRTEDRLRARLNLAEKFCSNSMDTLDAVEVAQAVDDLPDSQRQIVVLHLWGQLKFEQIGEIVNISKSTAHRRYLEALEQLRVRFACQVED